MLHVGVNAQLARNFQRTLNDIGRAEFGVIEQRHRRCLRICTAGADGDNTVFRLQYVAVAGNDERGLAVSRSRLIL